MAILLRRLRGAGLVGVSLATWLAAAAACGSLGGGPSASQSQGCWASGEGDAVELLQHNLQLQQHGVKPEASEETVVAVADSLDIDGIPDEMFYKIIDSATGQAYYGPLALLPGTWTGQQGKHWSCMLMSFPLRGSDLNLTFTDTKDGLLYGEVGVEVEPPGRFVPDITVAHDDYQDTLVFKEIAGHLQQRGLDEDRHMKQVSYEQVAGFMKTAAEMGFPEGKEVDGLHEESGVLAWVQNQTGVERQVVMGHGLLPYLAGDFDAYYRSDAKEELLRQVNRFDYGLRVEPQGCFPAVLDLPGDAGALKEALVRSTEAIRQVDFFVRLHMEDFAPLGQNPWLLKQFPVTEYRATWWIVASTAQDGSREWLLQYAQVQRLAVMHRLECMTCPGAERGPDGCYDKAEILRNAQCFFDANATVPAGQPSCREQERATFPHVQISTLKKIA